MKTKFKLFGRLFVGLTIMSLVVSCQENEPNIQKNQPEVWVDNQTMHFRDKEAFNKTMADLHKMTFSERKKWLDENEFENSLFEATQDTSYNENSNYVDVPDAVFASILNKDGVFKVGKKVHKITDNYELVKEVEAKQSIEKIDWSNEKFISKHKIVFGDIDYKHWLPKINYNQRTTTTNTNSYRPYGSDPSRGTFVDANGNSAYIKGVEHLSCYLMAWNRSYFHYASAGIKIKGRKNDGGWRNDAMHYAAFDYDAYGEYAPGTIPTLPGGWQSGSKSGTHEKDVQKTIFSCTGPPYSSIYVAGFEADFTYEDDGYPKVYRNNETWDDF